MRVAIAADHAGFPLKEELAPFLEQAGHQVIDLGAYQVDPSDDYPDFAKVLGDAVVSGRAERGILVCGSGVGGCIVANKIAGVRAAVCHDTYSAHQGVEHDDMNVVCLGGRIIGVEVAKEIALAFLSARFSGEERHLRRLNKLKAIEREALRAPQRTGSG
ncbi:MAG: ribose 5-phosphate isomerase B [Chloroflexi bacterium]|nr:ribose 5-phosphate isomerase B [Chloroflexota bacterium]